MRLRDKSAVVTGAGSGIGLAIARRFAMEGARLVIGDWNGERLEAAAAEIRDNGGDVSALQGNIAVAAAAEALVDDAVGRYGRIDVLVNNAGVMDYMQGVGELDDDIWRRVMTINLDGAMFTMRRAVPRMMEQGAGSIINIASIAGLEGGGAGAAYTASKHALIGLTKNTAWMYATRGIRANAIAPGGTKTKISESMPQERVDPAGSARVREYMALAPVFLDPEDIAALAAFLASDEARYINGAVIAADGGWTAA